MTTHKHIVETIITEMGDGTLETEINNKQVNPVVLRGVFSREVSLEQEHVLALAQALKEHANEIAKAA